MAVFGALQYAFVFRLPFVADDYTILEKVWHASFASLWSAAHPLWHWYRPWSRELHFWVLTRLFGVNELAFHVASFALWVAVLTAYFTFVRRIMGTGTAVIAVAGAAGLAAWASALSWAAGAQELWMLLFAILFLHAVARHSMLAAQLALAGALLSKETAAVLPAIAFLHALMIDRDLPRVALRRVAPQVLMVALWAVLHPFLRGRLAGGEPDMVRPSAAVIGLRTVLSVVNLDQWPEPEIGWPGSLIPALPGIALLTAGAAWLLRRAAAAPEPVRETASSSTAGAPPPATGVRASRPTVAAALFALGWAALAALPLFMPGVGWLAYYALLAALGVWAALAAVLAAQPWPALAAVALVAALQPVHATTPSYEWASDYYQRRAAYFVGGLKRDLLALHPTLPRNTRLWFINVPNGTGIGAQWFNPAFHVWYRDSTVTGDLSRNYVARLPGEPTDRDFFFRFKGSTLRWIELVRGTEDVALAQRANPDWPDDHRDLAVKLSKGGDWRGAAEEIEKLMSVFPGDPQNPRNLAVCLGALGDTLGMRRNMRIADSLRAARRVDGRR